MKFNSGFSCLFVLLGLFICDSGKLHAHVGTIWPPNSIILPEGEEEDTVTYEMDSDLFNFSDKQYVSWNKHKINIYNLDLSRTRDTFDINFECFERNKFVYFTFPVRGDVNSGFGFRNLFGHRFHYGVDLGLRTGDTVVAALDGVVRVVRYEPGYGNFLVIAHHDGLETLYGHLDGFIVKEGQEVFSGDPIALGGSTGRSTGPHLHFEILFMGERLDPTRILDFENQMVLSGTLKIDNTWFEHLKLIRGTGKAYHTVRQGETLDTIAKRYNLSVSRLCALNGLNTKSALLPGRKLRYA
jgi:murein DD-endopeptidase MepM/ murein hydrolase activator NlpD